MHTTHLLIFRLSSIGDVAMGVPVVMAALEQNPEVRIDFVAPKWLHSLFPKHPRLGLINFDKKKQHQGIIGVYKFYQSLDIKQYNAFADFHYVLRSHLLRGLIQSNGIATAVLNKGRKEKKALITGKNKKQLQVTTERYADVLRKLNLNVQLDHTLKDFHHFNVTKTKTVGFAPFAAHRGKMYDIKSMEKVVLAIQKLVPVKIFGSALELNSIAAWEKLPYVRFVKENSFADELKVMATLQLMVSMDSANMHLASLVGVPVLSLWGTTHPYAGFLGYGQAQDFVIQDETLDWRPTSIYGNKLGPEDNPNGMKNILPEQIIDKIKTIIRL